VGVIEKPIAKYPNFEARNYIDRFTFAKLRKFQVLPSQLSSDQEFLRRGVSGFDGYPATTSTSPRIPGGQESPQARPADRSPV